MQLKFTKKQIEELVKQGDANYMNKDKVLVAIYQNLYKLNGDYYYNVQQGRKDLNDSK